MNYHYQNIQYSQKILQHKKTPDDLQNNRFKSQESTEKTGRRVYHRANQNNAKLRQLWPSIRI